MKNLLLQEIIKEDTKEETKEEDTKDGGEEKGEGDSKETETDDKTEEEKKKFCSKDGCCKYMTLQCSPKKWYQLDRVFVFLLPML